MTRKNSNPVQSPSPAEEKFLAAILALLFLEGQRLAAEGAFDYEI